MAPPGPAAASTTPPADANAAKNDKSDTKGPSSEALIKRYMGVVLAQPGADFPLQRLLELYRERDGQLDGLIADLMQRAEAGGPTRYAALVARAGIEKLEGRPDRAQTAYERAIGEDPKNPIAVVALARMFNEQGDKAQARARFEQALPALKDDADREQVLRTLLGLCLDLKDYDAAKRYHEELVKRAGGSFFVRAEPGRELLARGVYDRAATEYKVVMRAAAGDNRVLAPALRDYGKALEKLGKTEEALVQFRHALELAGESGVRRELEQAIVDTYRQKDRLPELISELEKRPSARADDLRTLGELYEETGQVDKALVAYRRALAADGKDLATRLKVVHLLEVRGDLEQAIAEYDALIRAAPRNPDFVFQLAEALISRGDRKKALARLQELEARSGNDEETLAALVDFYERVDEKDRALALLQRLVAAVPPIRSTWSSSARAIGKRATRSEHCRRGSASKWSCPTARERCSCWEICTSSTTCRRRPWPRSPKRPSYRQSSPASVKRTPSHSNARVRPRARATASPNNSKKRERFGKS
jgi:cellulose synthase operon protein C